MIETSLIICGTPIHPKIAINEVKNTPKIVTIKPLVNNDFIHMTATDGEKLKERTYKTLRLWQKLPLV